MPGATTVYGPPPVVLRLTLNAVAPAAPDHESVTRPSPARADSAVGTVGTSHDRIALFTSSRPPVIVIDVRLETRSAVSSKIGRASVGKECRSEGTGYE